MMHLGAWEILDGHGEFGTGFRNILCRRSFEIIERGLGPAFGGSMPPIWESPQVATTTWITLEKRSSLFTQMEIESTMKPR